MWTSTLIVFLSLAAVTINGLPTSRVVGGEDAPEGKYPYQVSLQRNSKHTCGGSIISDRFIITAAHCVDTTPIVAVVGTNKLNSGGVKYKIIKTFVHSRWNSLLIKNDIALLLTDEKIVFSKKVQPIRIAPNDYSQDGYPVVATGWGRIATNGPIPNELQELNLQIHDQRKCRRSWGIVSQGQICTLTKRGEGVCNGDSGGPLVADGYLVGLVSFGRPCAKGAPDVYTRVHYYSDWIMQTMRNY